jgi:tRNA pseudouridine32 synthase/23S rRNA pseudouridine746 synthase
MLAPAMSSQSVAHQAAVYEPPPDQGWQPIHLDEHLVVVDKPSGLLTVPGRGDHLQDCLIHRVQLHLPEALIVHRLDMDTSGLVILARGPDMQRALSKLFMDRLVHKRYEAVVMGLMEPDEGEINAPLITDWPNRPRQMIDSVRGKPSLTRFRVLERDAALRQTRVGLEPVTGRSHQLRVHLLSLGHPIVGDPLYGPASMGDNEARASTRMRLHACELALPHPWSGAHMHWRSACPF